MHFSPMRVTCPANLIFLDLVTLIGHYMMMNKIAKLLRMQLSPNSCYPPLQTLRSKHPPQRPTVTFNRCSSLTVRDKVSRPNNATDKIIVLNNVIFMLFDSKRWGKCINLARGLTFKNSLSHI